ncbi:FRG domain-containing protein [Desertibacillus haloalkaliphilus]|uniref:FRG domain-containing protein n=1 Tax=Desertibacillus haloalkaliphilus TaxID=1328930 RepID=UPI001C263DB9|nr:FRG domain-containing protein [Desertibacillus haloalkaliphilus]MBU8907984.1 FRG domain-containing protein [Desertibacillus haloalkaliphilus]
MKTDKIVNDKKNGGKVYGIGWCLFMSDQRLNISDYFFSEQWIKILDEVTFFSKKSRGVWYRGQNNNRAKGGECYRLQSGLFRMDMSVDQLLEWEQVSYKRFLENGFELHKTTNEWDLLYLMQHYGVKTRLLDWTESFAVALYFATRNWTEKNECSVWLLDPYRLNEIFHGTKNLISMPRESSFLEERTSFAKTLALFPYMNSSRSMNQKGIFTLQGNTKLGLEEEEEGILFDKKIVKHIHLKPDLKNDIKMFLELSGINHFTLFPDLDGLASFVNQWTTEDIHKKDVNIPWEKADDYEFIRDSPQGSIHWEEDKDTYR